MTLSEFQELSKRTLNPACGPDSGYVLGLIGETGEITDIIKKVVWHGHPLDRDKLCLELGDLAFYVAAEATTLGMALQDIFVARTSLQDPAELCKMMAKHVAEVLWWISYPSASGTMAALHALIGTIDALGAVYSIPRDEILQRNYDKLLARYPHGFSQAASQQRTA